MIKTIYLDNNTYLKYKQQEFAKDAPTILFVHGLMSDMHGVKPSALEEFALQNNMNFVAFDNFGHGSSSMDFLECNISTWLFGLYTVIEYLTEGNIRPLQKFPNDVGFVGEKEQKTKALEKARKNPSIFEAPKLPTAVESPVGPIIIVGSSMGGWISTLAATNLYKLKGLILIAPAINFTEDIWENLTRDLRQDLKRGLIYKLYDSIPISMQLIEDGKKHLLTKRSGLRLDYPTTILHGAQDRAINYKKSIELFESIECPSLNLKLSKYSSHNFADDRGLSLIKNSILEML